MAYLLPRAVIILIGWVLTCVLIRNLWPDSDSMVFIVAGASWIVGGTAYFAYLRKLRRDIEELERNRRILTGRRAT